MKQSGGGGGGGGGAGVEDNSGALAGLSLQSFKFWAPSTGGALPRMYDALLTAALSAAALRSGWRLGGGRRRRRRGLAGAGRRLRHDEARGHARGRVRPLAASRAVPGRVAQAAAVPHVYPARTRRRGAAGARVHCLPATRAYSRMHIVLVFVCVSSSSACRSCVVANAYCICICMRAFSVALPLVRVCMRPFSVCLPLVRACVRAFIICLPLVHACVWLAHPAGFASSPSPHPARAQAPPSPPAARCRARQVCRVSHRGLRRLYARVRDTAVSARPRALLRCGSGRGSRGAGDRSRLCGISSRVTEFSSRPCILGLWVRTRRACGGSVCVCVGGGEMCDASGQC